MSGDQQPPPGTPPPDAGGHAADRLREQMMRDLGEIPEGHDPGRPFIATPEDAEDADADSEDADSDDAGLCGDGDR